MKEQHKNTKQSLSNMMEGYFDQHDLTCLQGLHALVLQEVEKPLIIHVLKKTNHNQSKAASILGLNRNTLKKKMLAFGLIQKDTSR